MKNFIIKWLVERTHLTADVVYTVLNKCSVGEIENYLKQRERKEDKNV